MKYIIFRYCITNMNIYKYCLNFGIETVNEIKHFFNMAFLEIRYKLYVRKHLNKHIDPVLYKPEDQTSLDSESTTASCNPSPSLFCTGQNGSGQGHIQVITEKVEIKCENNYIPITQNIIENKFDEIVDEYDSDGLSYGHESEVMNDEVISDLNCNKKRVYESDENSVMSTDEIAENIYKHNINYKNCISELKNIKKIRFE